MLISLSGKKQSGKSTITNDLCQAGWIEVSWAEPLKENIGAGLFGLSREQLYGSEQDKERVDPRWGMSARYILQLVGTDMFRKQICDDFWVKLGKRRIEHFLTVGSVVVSDTRFPNELEAVQSLGGHTVNVVRIGQINVDPHPSETALDTATFDHIISAESGALTDLIEQMHEYIKNV